MTTSSNFRETNMLSGSRVSNPTALLSAYPRRFMSSKKDDDQYSAQFEKLVNKASKKLTQEELD